MITKLIGILPPLILLMNVLGGISGNDYADSGNSATETQTGAVGVPVVDLVLLERTPKQLKFQVKINNTGERAVLIVSDPVRVDGSAGAYLSLDKSNPHLLEMDFTVFPPPLYTIYAPKNRVTFLRLDPGATHTEEVVLDQPFKDTKPPWGEWQDTKRINIENLQQVVARIGVLPDDPAVHAALINVPAPNGLERVSGGPLKGKMLLDIQTIVSSNVVKL